MVDRLGGVLRSYLVRKSATDIVRRHVQSIRGRNGRFLVMKQSGRALACCRSPMETLFGVNYRFQVYEAAR